MTDTALRDDERARERIRTDLDINFLVEAGAGSGKTTSMVGRMLSHVRRGTPIGELAAVTFTRKAATELRERFEVELEKALREALDAGDGVAARRLNEAREQLDRAFVGTIHAFCARLLREHPLEAGFDPSFEEIAEEEWPDIQREFWNRWLERCRRAGDPALDRLRELGLDPRALYTGFESIVRYPDVDFPVPERTLPDHGPCRRRLEALMRRADALMPADEPEGGWDKLQAAVRRLRFAARTGSWDRVASFCDGVAFLSASRCEIVQKRWADDRAGKEAAKELAQEFVDFVQGDLQRLLVAWREHRYAPVVTFLRKAADEFARERRATGRLGFEDLLLGAAKLLREHAGARRALGTRFRYLLVDEFQDTDPIQAEVCFLLASDPETGTDWRRVTPRPGALFVVGDPKQSIYRFRRADIATYEQVKACIRRSGEVLHLSRNFRSVDAVAELVNEHFKGAFPAAPSDVQAAFTPLVTRSPGEGPDGVYYYRVTPDERNKADVVATCAAQVATWIAGRIERGECVPGDFLVLAYRRQDLAAYARALAERNVPVAVTGAGLTQERELRELIVVLRALADPTNPVLVAAALEGLFLGCSPGDLLAARETRLDLSITHPPEEDVSPVGRGLATLHRWWIASQRSPADLVLDRILDDTGLLPWATSQPLGENRAGALIHLVEALRTSAVRAGGTLGAAIETIERVLAEASSDAPLRPGRGDAVRVMNLHKAKGLEARVVILAAPVARAEHPVRIHVHRDPAGVATGGIAVHDAEGNLLAQPAGWAEMVDAEERFLEAERTRLLYVATTRAKRELVVARLFQQLKTKQAEDKSMWSPLAPALERCGRLLELGRSEPPGRLRLDLTVNVIRRHAFEAEGRRIRASGPSFRMETVTESAKSERETERTYDLRLASGRGAAWGRAVHRALEACGRGRSGEALERFIRAVVMDERLDEGGADVDELVSELATLVERIRDSEAWRDLLRAERRAFELPVVRVAPDGDGTVVTEGVIDAAALVDGEWRIYDWKTDDVPDETWTERLRSYERQVAAYADMLRELAGRPARGEVRRVARK